MAEAPEHSHPCSTESRKSRPLQPARSLHDFLHLLDDRLRFGGDGMFPRADLGLAGMPVHAHPERIPVRIHRLDELAFRESDKLPEMLRILSVIAEGHARGCYDENCD